MAKEQWFKQYQSYLKEVDNLRATVQYRLRQIENRLSSMRVVDPADYAQAVALSNHQSTQVTVEFNAEFEKIKQKYSILG
jgi:vacuolar-type H+-ATPase subunit D/Vma8